MFLHVHMTVGFETDTFFFQEKALTTPPRSGSSYEIHYPMTRK